MDFDTYMNRTLNDQWDADEADEALQDEIEEAIEDVLGEIEGYTKEGMVVREKGTYKSGTFLDLDEAPSEDEVWEGISYYTHDVKDGSARLLEESNREDYHNGEVKLIDVLEIVKLDGKSQGDI